MQNLKLKVKVQLSLIAMALESLLKWLTVHIASAETFRNILEGETNPTSAFMGGTLKVEGSMGVAMQLGNILG